MALGRALVEALELLLGQTPTLGCSSAPGPRAGSRRRLSRMSRCTEASAAEDSTWWQGGESLRGRDWILERVPRCAWSVAVALVLLLLLLPLLLLPRSPETSVDGAWGSVPAAADALEGVQDGVLQLLPLLCAESSGGSEDCPCGSCAIACGLTRGESIGGACALVCGRATCGIWTCSPDVGRGVGRSFVDAWAPTDAGSVSAALTSELLSVE